MITQLTLEIEIEREREREIHQPSDNNPLIILDIYLPLSLSLSLSLSLCLSLCLSYIYITGDCSFLLKSNANLCQQSLIFLLNPYTIIAHSPIPHNDHLSMSGSGTHGTQLTQLNNNNNNYSSSSSSNNNNNHHDGSSNNYNNPIASAFYSLCIGGCASLLGTLTPLIIGLSEGYHRAIRGLSEGY